MSPKIGYCLACGRELVQVDGRTYHPAVYVAPQIPCPSYFPMDGMPGMYVLDVPSIVFMELGEYELCSGELVESDPYIVTSCEYPVGHVIVTSDGENWRHGAPSRSTYWN